MTDVDAGINGIAATVSFNPADGAFTAASLAAAGFTGQNGNYTLTTGTDAASLTSDLQTLVFTPTAHQTPPGQQVTTGFTLALDDQHGGVPSDATTSVVATATETAPAIGGTAANQSITDAQTANPFSGVTIADPDANASESTAITVTAGGVASDANGTFTPVTGLTKTGVGTYTLTSDAPGNVQAALRALAFTPTAHQATPGASVTTSFALSVSDGIAPMATLDATTSVVATAADDPPVISGTTTTPISDQQTANPFSGVSVTDVDAGINGIAATVSFNPADGAFTAASLAAAGFTGQNGNYTSTTGADAATLTSDLRELVFRPTAHQAAPGQQVTTGFTLALDDQHGGVPSNATTSVVATATETAPAIGGTAANQSITDAQTANPFSGVTIADPDAGASESTTITVTVGGVASDADGAFAPATGLTHTDVGTYTLASGTPAEVQAALQALVFTPTPHQVTPGASVATGFSLSVSDGIAPVATTDTTTGLVAAAADDRPAIVGTKTTAITDAQTANPFSGVGVIDVDTGVTGITATVSFNPADGAFTAASLAAAGFTGQNGNYTSTTGADAATLTSDLRELVFRPTAHQAAPGSTVTTAFALSLDDRHGGTTADDMTLVRATAASGPNTASPSPAAFTPSPTNNTPTAQLNPSVAFDPTVVAAGSTVTLTGTASASPGSTVSGVELYEGTTDLGAATLNGDGTWSFAFGPPAGFHTGLAAVATDSQGLQTTVPSNFDLTIGMSGQGYATALDNYDPTTGDYLGSTFFKRGGAIFYESTYAALPNGGSTCTYSGGAFFHGKDFTSFTDTYDAAGNLTQLAEINTDGSRSVDIEANGQTTEALGDDMFADHADKTRFVFHNGFGHDTISGFQATGSGHDVLQLPASDASKFAQILKSMTSDGQGDATLHLGGGNTIELIGITKAELKTNHHDLAFTAE